MGYSSCPPRVMYRRSCRSTDEILTLRHKPMALIAPNLLVAGVASFILTIGFDVASKPDDGFASWHIPMLLLLV